MSYFYKRKKIKRKKIKRKKMRIEDLYQIYSNYPIITTDSRNCPKDSLFFALKGENFDGNNFAEKAIEQGCRYAIIDNIEKCKSERFILVDNVLSALRNLAAYHRQQLSIPIIGITGTNGKTTTKELIATVLNKKYKTLFTQGNLNNHIGVPLTLLQITSEHEMAVVEMGANHPGEIRDSVEIVCPNFGIITNVGKAHLEGFGSFEGVIATKGELYDYLRENNGHVFINENNEHLQSILKDIPHSSYGISNPKADISGEVTNFSPFVSINWKKYNEVVSYTINTKFIGDYNAENMLAAICVGNYFGVGETEICDAIENYTPKNNRSQLTETAKNKLIIDTYNANPTSMSAALKNFSKMNFEQKTVLLGDMLELGDASDEEHLKIIDFIAKADFRNVFLVGKIFSALAKEKYPTFENIDDFSAFLNKNPLENQCILIKGSHGIHLEKVIERL